MTPASEEDVMHLKRQDMWMVCRAPGAGRSARRNGMEWNGIEWNGMEWNGMIGHLLIKLGPQPELVDQVTTAHGRLRVRVSVL